jgi:CarD family transcriptional regulator
MAKIGELVRYGQSGVCRIDEIRTMKTLDREQEYYILTPLFKASSVLYVPCENAELVAKMRPLLQKEEIEPLVKEAKERKTEWIRDFRRRSDLSKKALSSSEPIELLLLIKTICEHRKEEAEAKRVHTTDDYFLRDAEMLLYSEIAFVAKAEMDEVKKKIKTALGILE